MAASSLTANSGPARDTGLQWPPFRNFGDRFYTIKYLSILKSGRLGNQDEPHPRFYTDPTDTVPIAVPALLRTNWWPMVSFVVFKSPPEVARMCSNQANLSRKCLSFPGESEFELVKMDEEEAAERELQVRRIHASRNTLSAEYPLDVSFNTVFDGT